MSRRSIVACGLASTLAVACHVTDAIELPQVAEGMNTLALIVVADDGAIGVFAFDLRDPEQNALAFPTQPHATLYALEYEKNLGELSFETGWQKLRTDNQGVPMPRADALFESQLEDTQDTQDPQDGAWKSIPVLPDMISSKIRLDRPNPCIRFEVERLLVPDAKGNGRIIDVIDDDTALIGTDRGYYYLLDGHDLIRQTQISTTTPGFSGVRAADGELWVVSVDGRIAHGDHLRGFQPAPSLNVPGVEYAWIRAAPPGNPFELFASTDVGTFERFDGRSWTLIEHSPPPPNRGYDWRGGLAWIRPETAIAIGPRFPLMVRYDHGAVTAEQPFDILDSPAEVDVFPETGLIAGSEHGLLITYDEAAGRWRQIPGTEQFQSPIVSWAPLDRGLLFGGQFGTLQQYQPEIGLCGSEPYASNHITRIKPFGDGFLFFSAKDEDLDLQEVFILRRIR